MFVLLGNFTSKTAGEGSGEGVADYPALKDGFASLAALIERHDKIKVGGRRNQHLGGSGNGDSLSERWARRAVV